MEALPRPRQVTVAGWLIMACSAAVILTVYDQIAGIHTLDTREAMEQTLSEPPFDGLGLSVGQVLGITRVLATIAGACAAATAVLGWHVLQRSRSSRVVLSVLAVPLFLTGLPSGAVLSAAVAAAVVLLWLQPARDWFDGRWKPSAPQAARPQRPDPVAGPDAPPPAPTDQPPAWRQPYGEAVAAPAATVAPLTRRPGAVLAVAILTWVSSVVVAGLFIAGAIVARSNPGIIGDELANYPEFADQGVTIEIVQAMFVVMAGVIALWALSACVLAFLLLRRSQTARVLLALSTAGAGFLMLLSAIFAPVVLVPVAACCAALVLLLRRDVAAWFNAPKS